MRAAGSNGGGIGRARSEMRLSAPAHEDKWRARRKTLMAAFNHWVEQRYARAQVPLY